MKGMDLHAIRLEIPSDGNIIVGHSHFIKTVEDIYEAIINTVPQMNSASPSMKHRGPA